MFKQTGATITRVPRFVRNGLGRMTDTGFKGQDPVLTHALIPGKNRREKRQFLRDTKRFRRFTKAISKARSADG